MSNYTLWGPATWILFHTLAEKVKEDKFTIIKYQLISFVKQICTSLPCPDCAQHATQLLSQYKNYHLIKTKEDFKLFLFNFHNMVNARLKVPPASKEMLDKYKTTVFQQVFEFWYINFKVASGGNNKLMIDAISRERTKTSFHNFLKSHAHFFVR